MQTRLQSFIESCSNITIGYFVALGTQMVVFPIYGMKIQLSQNVQIGIIFTVVSLIRSYLLRRYYNRKHQKFNQNKHLQK